MSVLIQILSLLASIAPVVQGSGKVGEIITTIEQVIALGTSEVTSVMPYIQNIIAALKGNTSITADQLVQLQALEVPIDADFDSAAKDAEG